MDYKYIQQLLENCCLNETIDCLHFWGPAYELSIDYSSYDEVIIRIEGTFELFQNGEKTVVTREASDQLVYLTALARQKISLVQLVEPNDLFIQFTSGKQLRVIGDNEQFEGWQLHAKVEDDSAVVIVAGPGDQLTLFE